MGDEVGAVEVDTDEVDTRDDNDEMDTGEVDTRDDNDEMDTGEVDTRDDNDEMDTDEVDTRDGVLVARLQILMYVSRSG